MCIRCKAGMKLREMPCLRNYSRQDIEIWEEIGKQKEFERRLKKAKKRGKA